MPRTLKAVEVIDLTASDCQLVDGLGCFPFFFVLFCTDVSRTRHYSSPLPPNAPPLFRQIGILQNWTAPLSLMFSRRLILDSACGRRDCVVWPLLRKKPRILH